MSNKNAFIHLEQVKGMHFSKQSGKKPSQTHKNAPKSKKRSHVYWERLREWYTHYNRLMELSYLGEALFLN